MTAVRAIFGGLLRVGAQLGVLAGHVRIAAQRSAATDAMKSSRRGLARPLRMKLRPCHWPDSFLLLSCQPSAVPAAAVF